MKNIPADGNRKPADNRSAASVPVVWVQRYKRDLFAMSEAELRWRLENREEFMVYNNKNSGR